MNDAAAVRMMHPYDNRPRDGVRVFMWYPTDIKGRVIHKGDKVRHRPRLVYRVIDVDVKDRRITIQRKDYMPIVLWGTEINGVEIVETTQRVK